MYKRLALIICAAFSITNASAQTESSKQKELFHNYSKLLSPEKVYLHTDKDVYFATDTIWFSGYVENASYASEFDESNYIYVELIGDQLFRDYCSWINFSVKEPDVVARKKIRRIGNSFQGYIIVPEMHSTGRAVIRAYTYWMLNRPADYMFYKELELTNPMKDKLVSAMAEKKIKRKKEYIRLGEKSPFEKENQEEERYDVQFLPESGNYIQGTNSVVYLKAIGRGGAGVQVFGEIMDSDDKVVAQYSTDSLGFGKIEFESLPQGKLYATVKDSFGYEGKKVKLPVAVEEGVAIHGTFNVSTGSIYGDNDNMVLKFSVSPSLLGNSLRICLHNGSEIYYSKPINEISESITLSLKPLTVGIHSVSVVDNAGNVYAERPFLVLPTEKETLKLNAQKVEFGKRELVNVKISLPKEMLDNYANFSVSVTDMGIIDNCEKTTMQSYMLLKSELKGHIENIDWYFNDTISLAARMHRADMLMQTQGWRYYDVEKIMKAKNEMPHFGREYKQTLFGKVVNPLTLTKKATVAFVAPSINFKAMGQIDSGYWVLKDIDFPEDTRFIISATGKNGKSTSHMPIMQNDYYAPIMSYPVSPEKVVYTPKYQKIVETIYYSHDEDGEHAMAFELNPVIVTSQLITPKNSPSPIPNYPIRKEWYRDSVDMKPYVRSCSLGEYVADTYSGLKYRNGALWGYQLTAVSGMGVSSRGMSNREGPVDIYLDRMEVQNYEEAALLDTPVSEFESIIYVSGLSAAPFQFGMKLGQMFPSPVLMVRTKPHVRTDEIPYNVSQANPLGWQKPARFYSPRYNTQESLKSKEKDNRITLYWNPAVKLDENGEATISFYTSDSDSQYRIEVEGRSSSRQYHYAEKIIERKVESEPASRRK